jgi:hypothetical protein
MQIVVLRYIYSECVVCVPSDPPSGWFSIPARLSAPKAFRASGFPGFTGTLLRVFNFAASVYYRKTSIMSVSIRRRTEQGCLSRL